MNHDRRLLSCTWRLLSSASTEAQYTNLLLLGSSRKQVLVSLFACFHQPNNSSAARQPNSSAPDTSAFTSIKTSQTQLLWCKLATYQQISLSLASTSLYPKPDRISTTSRPTAQRPNTMSQPTPRQRLSLYTNRTLSHDVTAALKGASPLRVQTTNLHFEPTPAPPPSPVDFGSYSSEFSSASEASEWSVRNHESGSQAIAA